MNLFNFGDFPLASGTRSPFLIDCKFLSHEEWIALTDLALCFLKPFTEVEGVPTGGNYWADCLANYCQPEGGLLIVEDVWTTGASMEKQRAGRKAQGIVLFARSMPPPWVVPLFYMLRDVR